MSDTRKYIDLQVNGYAGVDFNSMDLTEAELLVACNKLYEDNVDSILATLITDDYSRMIEKIKNLAKIISENKQIRSIIQGIHIEGPFLSPTEGFRGAHPKEYIISSDLEKLQRIVDSGSGLVRLVTLAPEIDKNFEMSKFLSSQDIIVSGGHSNASLAELNGAIDNGLKLFTHLGNGSPQLLPRHDNIINRILSLAGKLSICFIADGIHIPVFALSNYIKVAGLENSIIVTDCMAAASAPPGLYSVSHINVEVGEDKVVRELGKENLAGSAITMKESELILKNNLNLNSNELDTILYKNAYQFFNDKTNN